jgi:hypothetical protein
MLKSAPFALIVQGQFPCVRLAPLPGKNQHFIKLSFHVCRLLGFIGPVPPPARDKRVSVQDQIITKLQLHVNDFLGKIVDCC